jgi:transposase
MRRFELSDEQFALLEPLLPPKKATGRPRSDDRTVLNGLLWKMSTGASWRDIPERYGPWQTVYERFRLWRDDGTWLRIVTALQAQMDAQGQVDWSQFNIDGTSIRASRAAGGARKRGDQQANPQTTP